jgi:hypothetical protein
VLTVGSGALGGAGSGALGGAGSGALNGAGSGALGEETPGGDASTTSGAGGASKRSRLAFLTLVGRVRAAGGSWFGSPIEDGNASSGSPQPGCDNRTVGRMVGGSARPVNLLKSDNIAQHPSLRTGQAGALPATTVDRPLLTYMSEIFG